MNTRTKVKTKNALIAGKRVFLRVPVKDDLQESIALHLASLRLHRGLVYPPTRPAEFAAFLDRCRPEVAQARDLLRLVAFRPPRGDRRQQVLVEVDSVVQFHPNELIDEGETFGVDRDVHAQCI